MTKEPKTENQGYIKPVAKKPENCPPAPSPSPPPPPQPHRHATRDRSRPPPSLKEGGQVKKTGLYRLHKGEVVVPAKIVNKKK